MKKTDDVLTTTKGKKAPGALADATAKDIKKLEEHLAPLAPELFIWLKDAQICTVESKDDHTLVLINKNASYTINLDDIPQAIAQKLKVGDHFPLDKNGKLHEEWLALIDLHTEYVDESYADDKGGPLTQYYGLVTHYSHKNNPMIWANHRLNTVEQGLFKPGYHPKIGESVSLFFSDAKGEPRYTIYTGSDIDFEYKKLLTKKGHSGLVACVSKHITDYKAIKQKNGTLHISDNDTPEEVASIQQPEGKHKHTKNHSDNAPGLQYHEIKNFKRYELQEKSANIAMTLAYQARSQNEKIDALTYAYLPECTMKDLKVGTKVVSQKGTPGIIAELPSTEKKLHKSTAQVSYYRISKKGKKMHEYVIAKIGEFKIVKEPQKHVAKEKEQTTKKK